MTPPGRRMAGTSPSPSLRNSNRPGIFVIDLDDKSVQSLSQKYAFDSQPAWSKDGKQIVFSSDRNSRQDVWVMDADGQNQKQFTFTAFHSFNPILVIRRFEYSL